MASTIKEMHLILHVFKRAWFKLSLSLSQRRVVIIELREKQEKISTKHAKVKFCGLVGFNIWGNGFEYGMQQSCIMMHQ